MCLLREVLVIDAQLVLFKRNISRYQLPQYKKKETNTEQCRRQSSLEVEHRRKHLKNCYAPHLLEVDYIKDLLFSQQCTSSSPSQHSLRILSSLLPFTENISLHHGLCIVFSVFDDDDGHYRGHTSRHVVGAEVKKKL